MNKFTAIRRKKHCTQINHARPADVFPLLCPVREKEWIDGWQYRMIYSNSGIAEQGAIFTTPDTDGNRTTWYITRHEPADFVVDFVRITPGHMVVAIHIQLAENNENATNAHITYEYTSLSEGGNEWLLNKVDETFDANMDYWEKAINYYLATGEMLTKETRQ